MRRGPFRFSLCLTSIWLLLAIPAAPEQGLRIVAPPDGTVVEPGQTLTVTVEPTPGTSVQFVDILIPRLAADLKERPPFVFTVTIPVDARLGPHRLRTAARDQMNRLLEAFITLRIETATPVTSIQVTHAPVRIATDRRISVFGDFADDVTRKISRSGEITYTPSDPQVATVTPDGLIEPVENGEATITVTYKNQSFSFPIKVDFRSSQRLSVICAKLQVIVDSNPGTPLADKVEDALDKCRDALGDLAETPPDNQDAVGKIKDAVAKVDAAINEGLNPQEGTKRMDQLARTARQLATEALDQAIDEGGDSGKIADAQEARTEGDALRASSEFRDAVAKYREALQKAESALP
ncbi:MAG: Ig-like domain-containing protein [Candidatus Methylomirabilales bacterium]